MIARPLTGVIYRDAILRVVVIPLISGLTLAFLMRDHAPVLAVIVAGVTITQTNYASHWIGWLRHPTVITYPVTREIKMKTNRRSSTRLAVVSSTLMIGLMISAGCPPGDQEPPKTPAEESKSTDKDEDETKSEEKSKEDAKGDAKGESKGEERAK